MDATMLQKVKDTVSDFVNRGFMFTAFDITKVVRKDGHRVRHGEVNQAVQQMFADSEMGMYTRETVNVGAPVEPWVYYHPYSDVANYRQDWVEQNPDQNGMKNADGSDSDDGNLSVHPTTPTAQTQPTNDGDGSTNSVPSPASPTIATGATSVKSSATVTRSLNSANRVYVKQSEGRLNIPPVLVRQIASVGDAIQVDRIIDMAASHPNNKRLLIAKTVTGRRDYKVNSDGRVRISSQILNYLNGNGTYEIVMDNGNLVVAPI